MGDVVLVVDLGGSGIRVGLVDARGNLRILTKRRLSLAYPDDCPGAVEFSQDFEDEVKSAIAEAIHLSRARERLGIRAVVCVSMREGFVLLDSERRVIYAGPNADYRAVKEARELHHNIGSTVYRATGQWITPPGGAIQAPCRLLWFARHHPERLDRCATFMMLSDWLASLFSRELVCEASSASSSALLDLSTAEWRLDIVDYIGARHSMFPSVVASGTVIGPVRADDSGLGAHMLHGATVVSGGADTQCSLLGCGVYRSNQVAIVAGTTSPIQMVMNRPVLDPLMRTWTSFHVVPDSWVLESNAGKTGFAHAWLADIVGALSGIEATNDVYALLDRLAQESPPGAGGLTFALEPAAMGECRAGPAFRGAVSGLSCTGKNRTTASHLARALMENVAAAYSANLEQLERVSGEPIDSVMMCGGSTRSRVQTQIIADSSGRAVRVSREPETTMGQVQNVL